MSKLRNKPTELKSNVWIKEQYANPKYCMLEDLDCRKKQRQALLHWAYDSRII